MNKQVIINLKNIHLKFKSLRFFWKKSFSKTIFDNLNLTIWQGDKIALIGKNGSGKTTLIKMICQLLKNQKGKIEYNFSFKNSPLEKMSLLLQTNELIQNFYVSDYIKIILNQKNIDKNFVQEIFEMLDLKKIENQNIRSLSSGEKQKVQIFILLAFKPLIIFLDEYDNNIDEETRLMLHNYFDNYVNKYHATIIRVTHHLSEIANRSNRIIKLDNGKIISDERRLYFK